MAVASAAANLSADESLQVECKRALENVRDLAWRRRLRLQLEAAAAAQSGRNSNSSNPNKGESAVEPAAGLKDANTHANTLVQQPQFSSETTALGGSTVGAVGGREKNIVRLQKLVNKLKKITAAEKTTILESLKKLNVSLFLSEIADSIADLDFKVSDIRAVVEVCAALRLTYSDFLSHFTKSLHRQLKNTIEGATFFNTAAASGGGPTTYTQTGAGAAAVQQPTAFSSALLPQDAAAKLAVLAGRLRVLSRLLCELHLSKLLPEASQLLLLLLSFLTAPYHHHHKAASVSSSNNTSNSSVSDDDFFYSSSNASSSVAAAAASEAFPSLAESSAEAAARSLQKKRMQQQQQQQRKSRNIYASAPWTSSLALCIVRMGVLSSICRKAAGQLLPAAISLCHQGHGPASTLQRLLLVQPQQDLQQLMNEFKKPSAAAVDPPPPTAVKTGKSPEEAVTPSFDGYSQRGSSSSIEKFCFSVQLVNKLMQSLGVSAEDIQAAAAEELDPAASASRETQDKAYDLLQGFFAFSAPPAIRQVHQQLLQQEQQNIQQVLDKGQVEAEAHARFQQLTEQLKASLTAASTIAEVLDQPALDLQSLLEMQSGANGETAKKETGFDSIIRVGGGATTTTSTGTTTTAPTTAAAVGGGSANVGLKENISNSTSNSNSSSSESAAAGMGGSALDDENSMWRDPAEKEFYTNLLDLKEAIPAALLGLKEGARDGDNTSSTMTMNSSGKVDVEMPDDAATEESAAAVVNTKMLSVANEPSSMRSISSSSSSDDKSNSSGSFIGAAGSSTRATGAMDVLLLRLSQATEAHTINQIAIDLFYERLTTKVNRAALMKAIVSVPRTQLHLLPAYARLLAILRPYMKDVCAYVLASLQAELKKILEEKHPTEIEKKIKCIRFICECTKFRLFPAGFILSVFNTLVEDLTPHHAELLYHIGDACGYYLLHMRLTHHRFLLMLEKMLRMKGAKRLAAHADVLVEELYHQLLPPAASKAQKNQRDQPLHKLFIQKLIFEDLYFCEETLIARVLRRLPWSSEPKIERWFRNAILELDMHANYEGLHLRASLLCALAKYFPDAVIGCIDCLLEEIQAAMEREDPRDAPLRIRHMKLLGELYTYRLIDSSVIFDTLYHLCGFSSTSSYQAGNIRTAHRLLAEHLRNFRVLNSNSSSSHSQSNSNSCIDTSNNNSHIRSNNSSSSSSSSSSTSTDKGEGEASSSIDYSIYDQTPLPLFSPAAPLEPPQSCMRITLICTLLQTCAHYFKKGALRLKLDRFLLFFQRYARAKPNLPLLVEAEFLDTLDSLRPLQHPQQQQLARFDNLQEADACIRNLLREEAKILAAMNANDESGDEAAEDVAVFGAEAESEDEEEKEQQQQSESATAHSEVDDNDYVREGNNQRQEEERFENDFAQLVLASLSEAKMTRRARGCGSAADLTRIIPFSVLKEAAATATVAVVDTAPLPLETELATQMPKTASRKAAATHTTTTTNTTTTTTKDSAAAAAAPASPPLTGAAVALGASSVEEANEKAPWLGLQKTAAFYGNEERQKQKPDEDEEEEQRQRQPQVTVKLVLRRRADKRNRFAVKPLTLPADSRLTVDVSRKKTALEKQEREEREGLKRFVMECVQQENFRTN